MENFDTERFIREVQKRPAIWDSTVEEYSVLTLRQQCWKEIIEIFGGKGLTATEVKDIELTLQKKWKCLRGCFTRELRRQERVLAGDSPGPRKSQYKYFQQMFFLCKVVTSRVMAADYSDYTFKKEASSNDEKIKEEDSVNSPDEAEEEDDTDFKPIDMIKPGSDEEADPLRECSRIKRFKYDSTEEDEDKMFLLSLLSTLRRVPLAKKMETKIKLLTVLDQATRN